MLEHLSASLASDRLLDMVNDIEHASRQACICIKELCARHHIVMQHFALLALEDLSTCKLMLEEHVLKLCVISAVVLDVLHADLQLADVSHCNVRI